MNQLDIKNSDRRKIKDRYSDNQMLERKKFFIFRKNETLKKKKEPILIKKNIINDR